MRKFSVVFLIVSLSSCGSIFGNSKATRKPLPPSPPVQENYKPTPKQKAQGYYELGVSYINLGEIPVALNYLFKAKSLEPNNPNIYNAIGVAFYQKGDLSRSKLYLEKAISMKRDFSEAYLNLGMVYEKLGNYKLAEKFYQKALENPLYLTPEVAYYKLGCLLEKQGELEKAKSDLFLALKNNVDFIPAYLELAKIDKEQQKFEDAETIYYKLINYYPKVQEPYYRLAKLFLHQKKLKLASDFLRKCIAINPDSNFGIKSKLLLMRISNDQN